MDSQQKEGEERDMSAANGAPDEPGWHYDSANVAHTPTEREDDVKRELAPDEGKVVTWSASEFVAHHKSALWYLILLFGAAALAVVTYVFSKDIIAVVIIIFVAVLLAVLAGRKPRVLEYKLERKGVHIGTHFYPYSIFKSFSRMQEGAFASVTFMPMQRFMPPVSIYYAPEDEEKVLQTIADYLPLEHREPDALDKLLKKVRF